jgi:hypothetical protein
MHFLKSDNLRTIFPILSADVHVGMEALKGDLQGITDPFETIYRLIFQLTIRLAGPVEMAEDPELTEEVLQLFSTIDKSAGATVVMFPNTPTLPWLRRTVAGGCLYM